MNYWCLASRPTVQPSSVDLLAPNGKLRFLFLSNYAGAYIACSCSDSFTDCTKSAINEYLASFFDEGILDKIIGMCRMWFYFQCPSMDSLEESASEAKKQGVFEQDSIKSMKIFLNAIRVSLKKK